MQKAIARLRRESRWYMLRVFASVSCIILAFVLLILAVAAASHPGQNTVLLLCCLLCVAIGAMLIPHSDSKSLAALADAPDITMIGPLLESLEAAPEARARKIHALLTLLLPRIRSSDAVLLNQRQRRLLYRTLLYNTLQLGDADNEQEVEYLLAVLQAITYVGDQEAVVCLRQVVQRNEQTHVCQAASECLIAIETRMAQQHIHDSLLRASSPSENSAELLRGTQPDVETSPETLLRPS